MKLLFVADGRSPITTNWMRYFSDQGHEIHLASFYPCAPEIKLASSHLVPIPFSRASAPQSTADATLSGTSFNWKTALATPRVRTRLRQWLVPIRLPRTAEVLREIIDKVKPDLVHAMRLPYEGMAAALADPFPPLLISIWGNDFTLHADSTPLTARYTRRAMERADALHTDCQRDARLAYEWGYRKDNPLVVLPSGGGIQLDLFHPRDDSAGVAEHTVINPRGLRAYVRNDTFFAAVPKVLTQIPEVRFVCPGMANEREVFNWLDRYGGAEAVDLLPKQSRGEMARLFQKAALAVSLTTHDGTPNTLLEAMACGCYPVAGDLESVREWITPGTNGSLVPADDPDELADSIVRALGDPTIRATARIHNQVLIGQKAEHRWVMGEAEAYYGRIIDNHKKSSS